MRVGGTGRSEKVKKRGDARKNSASGPAFTIDSSEAPAKAGASGPAEPVAGMDAILALQAVDDPLAAKRKVMLKRGQSILEALEGMKADLLAGRVDERQLGRLMTLVRQAKVQSDPELDALIEDIELRAHVELAKLGRFPKA